MLYLACRLVYWNPWKSANPAFWSSWLAQLHQARSINLRKVFESKTICYLSQVWWPSWLLPWVPRRKPGWVCSERPPLPLRAWWKILGLLMEMLLFRTLACLRKQDSSPHSGSPPRSQHQPEGGRNQKSPSCAGRRAYKWCQMESESLGSEKNVK